MNKEAIIKSLEGRVSKTAGDIITRAVFLTDNWDAFIRYVGEQFADDEEGGEGDYIFDEIFAFRQAWGAAEREGRILRPINLGTTVLELVPGMYSDTIEEYITGKRPVDSAFEKAFERIVNVYTHVSPLAMTTGDFDGDLDPRVHVECDNGVYTLKLDSELAEKLLKEIRENS